MAGYLPNKYFMKATYTLSPHGFVYNINDHFPKLESEKKMGVFLSGGMESSLISLIAQKIYGADRVINFYSDNIFSANDLDINKHIRTNLERAKKALDITPTYLEFDYQFHVTDRKKSIENKILSLKEQYDVEFVMFGFTKLFFEVEVFKQQGMTEQRVKEIAFAKPERFASTIEEFHLETDEYTWHLLDIDIPAEVYHLLRQTSGFIRSPFKDLNKCEVVDFYNQLDALDILYKTSSCIMESLTKEGKHCGRCFNCQQRYDAFRILGTGIKDLTEYLHDDIVHRRERLERL
jgi:7-cyano-7-deazaguanine synthase in queuosine biosynthesis